MSGYKLGNTQSAWDEELQVSTHIGYKSEWINTGMKDGQRVVWKHKLIEASKADPKRNYYCCHKRCNAMIVNQGPVNEWFFSTKRSQGVIQNKCNIQDALKSFTNSSSESVKHLSAKRLIFDYLNENKSREMYDIDRLTMEEKINKGDIKIQPDITIYHHDKSVTYVEIVNFSSPHKNKNAWKFYENEPNLVIVDVKGNQEGWFYNHHLLRQILIDKFEYAYQNKGKNHIQLWEEANQAIAYCEEQSRNFSFAKLITILESTKKERNDKINSVKKEYERIYKEFQIMLSEKGDDYLLKNNLSTLLRKHSAVDNEIPFDRGIADYSKEAWSSNRLGPFLGGFFKKYSKAGIENYVREFKNKYQEMHTRFSDLEFFYQNSTKELFYNKQVIIDQTGFAQECHINLKSLDEKIDEKWVDENKSLLKEAEDLFYKLHSYKEELAKRRDEKANKQKRKRPKSNDIKDFLEAVELLKSDWITDLNELERILSNENDASQFARRFVKSRTGKRIENEDGSISYIFENMSRGFEI